MELRDLRRKIVYVQRYIYNLFMCPIYIYMYCIINICLGMYVYVYVYIYIQITGMDLVMSPQHVVGHEGNSCWLLGISQ